jgi:hypothetical protein
MTLQFNPYPILDPNQYRKPTLQEKLAPINEGIQNALQLYQQDRANRLQDINTQIDLQAHRRPDGSLDFGSATGTPSTSLGVTTKPQPTPLFGAGQPDSQMTPSPLFSAPAPTSTEPKPLFASAGTPDTGFSFQPGNPYNAPSQQSGPTQPNPPAAASTMTAPAPAPSQLQGPNFANMSPFELQNYQTRQKAQADLEQQRQNMDLNSDVTKTKQRIASRLFPGENFSGMTGAQLDQLDNLFGKVYSADSLKAYREAALNARGDATANKQNAADQKRWDQIVKDTDPYKASSRSALGVATLGNQRADRAIPVLQNPNATNQDIATAVADISGIFQGGVPTESGVHQQEYQTLLGKLANLKTYITGAPSAPAIPEVKQHLLDLVTQLKNVNNQTIKDQLDYTEEAYPDLIQKNRDAWTKIRSRIGVDQPAGGAAPQGSGPAPGMTRIRASDGSMHDLPTANLQRARQRDPNLQVVQ